MNLIAVQLIGGPHDGKVVDVCPGTLTIEVLSSWRQPFDRYRIALNQRGEFIARYVEPDDAS